MLKFLIGPAIVGAGYAVGSFYCADAQLVVQKSPSVTYRGMDQALANLRTAGMTSFEGGKPVPYEIKVARTPGEKLLVMLVFAGDEGAEAELSFHPIRAGQATLVEARIHANRSVLRSVLEGTNKARLGYAPDWMLNIAFKPVLQQLAQQIETGESARIEGSDDGDSEARWEANLSVEERGEVARWHQDQATQPALDPDQAARNYAEPTTD